jgi:hypothetical protein
MLIGSIALSHSSCFLKQDRTTVVYGSITDQKGQPVDSIMVIIQGMRALTYETLEKTYSDKNGNYEIVIDVPKKFHATSSLIPALPLSNPKFQRLYSSYDVLINNKPTNSCCIGTVGKKTKYDFQLIPK